MARPKLRITGSRFGSSKNKDEQWNSRVVLTKRSSQTVDDCKERSHLDRSQRPFHDQVFNEVYKIIIKM